MGSIEENKLHVLQVKVEESMDYKLKLLALQNRTTRSKVVRTMLDCFFAGVCVTEQNIGNMLKEAS